MLSRKPKEFDDFVDAFFNPQPDITVQELAEILKNLVTNLRFCKIPPGLDENLKRHFTTVEKEK